MGQDIKNYAPFNIRSSAVLTGAYVAGNIISAYSNAGGQATTPALNNQLILLVNWTKGDETSLEIKVEYSHDGVTYYQDTTGTYSAGQWTVVDDTFLRTSTGPFIIGIPIKFSYIKISSKANGGSPTGTCSIMSVVGTV